MGILTENRNQWAEICSLCCATLENVDHLFGHCNFFVVVWNALMLIFQMSFK